MIENFENGRSRIAFSILTDKENDDEDIEDRKLYVIFH